MLTETVFVVLVRLCNFRKASNLTVTLTGIYSNNRPEAERSLSVIFHVHIMDLCCRSTMTQSFYATRLDPFLDRLNYKGRQSQRGGNLVQFDVAVLK